MPTRRQEFQPDDSQFDLEMKRAAQVMRRIYKTAEILRCQVVYFPDQFTAQILTPQFTYRYVRKPLNAALMVGDYVSVLNPGGENSGKNWEIINVNISGVASGVISVNDFAGNVRVDPGAGITIDSILPNRIRINAETIIDHASGVGARVRRVAPQAIATATYTAVAWDTEDQDDDNFWVPLNSSRFTAPKTGWFNVGFTGVWAADTGNRRTLQIRKNGTEILHVQTEETASAVMNDPSMNVSGPVYLLAGQYVELWVHQNEGVNVNIQGFGSIAHSGSLTSYGTVATYQTYQNIAINNTYQSYNTYASSYPTYGTYPSYPTVYTTSYPAYNTILGGSQGVYVSRIAPQSLTFGTYNPIAWDFEHTDEAQYWDPGSPTRLVAPRNGWYSSSFRIQYATALTSALNIMSLVRKNAVDVLQEQGDSTNSVFNTNAVQNIGATFYLRQNDYIELQAQASNGPITARAQGQMTLIGSYDTVYQTLSYPTIYSYPSSYSTYNTLYGGALGVYVGRASIQSFTNQVFEPLIFDYEHRDDQNFWSSAEPTKIFAPRNGWYSSGLSLEFNWIQISTFNNLKLEVRKNGIEIIHGQEEDGPNVTGSGNIVIKQSVSGPLYLNQGEYLEYYLSARDSNLGGIRAQNVGARVVLLGSYDTVYQTIQYAYPTNYDYAPRNTYISNYPNIQSPLGLGTYVARRTNQVIESGIDTAVQFNYEHVDEDLLWDPALPSRFVSRRQGWYVFSFSNQWMLGDEGVNRLHFIRKNGAQNIHRQNSEEEWVNLAGVVQLNPNDYVENFVQQNTGISRNLQAIGTMAFFGSYVTTPVYQVTNIVYSTYGAVYGMAQGTYLARNATYSVANATGNIGIPFDYEHIDELGAWSLAAPNKIIVPTTGWYLIEGKIDWDSNTTGRRTLDIKINGTTFYFTSNFDPDGSVLNPIMQVGGPIRLQANDYIEVIAFQDSGAARTLLLASAQLVKLP